MKWPTGASHFTIHPESGKKRGKGNGVKPIKEAFIATLLGREWKPETRYPKRDEDRSALRPGAFDTWLDLSSEGLRPFVTEWETGNISSSHRALNKMAMALMHGLISGGILVLPTRSLYRYLTDRVGNLPEIEPYFPLWRSVPVNYGHLGILAVEHDDTSLDVPRIAKGTDGRALH